MRRFLAAGLSIAALACISGRAAALSGVMIVDPGSTNVEIGLANLFASTTGSASVSGTLDVDVALDSDPTFGLYVASLADCHVH